MKKGGGKAKGGEFERFVCKRLSLWLTQNEKEPSDDCLWRSAMSGGRATVRGKKGKKTVNAAGDLCAMSPHAKAFCELFTVECKKGYKGESLSSLADLIDPPAKGVPLYKKWIDKLKGTALSGTSASWLLIVAKHARLPFVLLPAYVYRRLTRKSDDVMFGTYGAGCGVLIHTSEDEIAGLPLASFLTLVSPEDVERVAKKLRRAA